MNVNKLARKTSDRRISHHIEFCKVKTTVSKILVNYCVFGHMIMFANLEMIQKIETELSMQSGCTMFHIRLKSWLGMMLYLGRF